MLIEAGLSTPDESLVDTRQANARLVAANQQDRDAFAVECQGDASYAAPILLES